VFLNISSFTEKSSNLTETSVLRLGGDFCARFSVASFVALEGDLRAGYLEAGLRLGDFRAGDLREGRVAGELFRAGELLGTGEVFRVLAGDRGGETPFRVRGGLDSIALTLVRPLLVDMLEENYTTRC
jgi:hypothetical protein